VEHFSPKKYVKDEFSESQRGPMSPTAIKFGMQSQEPAPEITSLELLAQN